MKIAIISRKRIQLFYYFIISVLSIAIISVSYCTASAQIVKKKALPIYCVDTDEKKIALTFDCAWENSDSLILMNLLNKYNIKATFFTTGDFCQRYSQDIEMFSQAGHSIQNHSNKHPHVENIQKQTLIDDTTACDEIITKITGKKPTLYRAPYGEFSNSMLSVFENELNHKVIQWSCDSIDWENPPPELMVKRIMKKVKPGGILLFHNDTENTPQALETLIPQLQKQGYEFVLVEDLIYYENYTLDHEGKQIPNK